MRAPPIATGRDLPPAIAELAAIPRWVCWRREKRKDKWTKVPYTTGLRNAKSTDPKTWDTFEACRLVAFEEGAADGIGIVLDGSDDLVGFDLDDCLEGSTLKPWAQAIAERLNSYTEVTPSGSGIRIFVRGKIPVDGRRKGQVEVYRARRFLTITGRHLAPFPTSIKRRGKTVPELFVELFGESPERVKGNGADHPGEWPPLPDPMPQQQVERELHLFPELQERHYASGSERDFTLVRHAWQRGWLKERAAAFLRAVRSEEDDKADRADYVWRTVAAVYDNVSDYDLAVERAAQLAPHEYDQVRKAEAKQHDVRVSTFDAAVATLRNKRSRGRSSHFNEEAQEDSFDLPLSRAQIERSHDLSGKSVLKRVADTVEELGAAGVSSEAKILYLAITTRLLPPPVIPAHVIVKGPSAGGKNYLLNTVARLFPESAIFKMTGMSDRALAYLDEPVAHRFIILAEAAAIPEDALAWTLIRSLLSEGEIVYPTVERDEETGRLVSVQHRLQGPTGLIMTTTLPKIHTENETRHLTINVSDEWSHTQAVLLEQAKIAQGKEVATVDLSLWHDYQRWLEQQDRRVVVPFAEQIVDLMRSVPVRVRRDFPRFLALVMAHALLHQAKRQRDTEGRLIASLEDYEAVHRLAGRAFAESADLRQREAITQLVGAVEVLDKGGEAGGVTIHTLIKHARRQKWGTDNRDVLTRRCREAIVAGLLVNLETKRGQLARYRVTGELRKAGMFPPPKNLAEACARPSTSTSTEAQVEPKPMKRKAKSRVRPRDPVYRT